MKSTKFHRLLVWNYKTPVRLSKMLKTTTFHIKKKKKAYQQKNADVYKIDSKKLHQYLFQLLRPTFKVHFKHTLNVNRYILRYCCLYLPFSSSYLKSSHTP